MTMDIDNLYDFQQTFKNSECVVDVANRLLFLGFIKINFNMYFSSLECRFICFYSVLLHCHYFK